MLVQNHTYFIWLYNQWTYRRVYYLGSGIFIWIFLSVSQPFGIYNTNLPFWGLSLFMLLFASFWPLLSFMVDTISTLFKVEIGNIVFWGLKIFLMVHAIYLLRELLCSGNCIDIKEYGEIWMATLLLFVMTYVPFMLFARYRYFHMLVGSIGEHPNMIELKGTGKDQLTLSVDGIAYLSADDNYVDVHLVDSDHKKEVLRATLADVEQQLLAYPQFVRIHRSYIANTRFALKPGNKRFLTILKDSKTVDLPVSKRYQIHLEKLFIHPKSD